MNSHIRDTFEHKLSDANREQESDKDVKNEK